MKKIVVGPSFDDVENALSVIEQEMETIQTSLTLISLGMSVLNSFVYCDEGGDEDV